MFSLDENKELLAFQGVILHHEPKRKNKMKKIRYIAILLVCLTTSTFAQTPNFLESAFHYKYPKTSDYIKAFHDKYPQISKEKLQCSDNVCAFTFKYHGEKKKAYFDKYSNWMRTETYMVDGEYIPDSIKVTINNSRYNGWSFKDTRLIETPDNTIYAVGLDYKNDKTGLSGHHYLYCTSSGTCSDKK